jgi:hypothetical protein
MPGLSLSAVAILALELQRRGDEQGNKLIQGMGDNASPSRAYEGLAISVTGLLTT